MHQVAPICTPPRPATGLTRASFDPPKSTSQTASRSVQPFFHSSKHSVPVAYNGPPLPLSKLPLHRMIWTASNRCFPRPMKMKQRSKQSSFSQLCVLLVQRYRRHCCHHGQVIKSPSGSWESRWVGTSCSASYEGRCPQETTELLHIHVFFDYSLACKASFLSTSKASAEDDWVSE